MHRCPECGQACYCNGDVDDCEIEGDAEVDCIHFAVCDGEYDWCSDIG